MNTNIKILFGIAGVVFILLVLGNYTPVKAFEMSNASLNGTYIMCQHGTDPDHWTDYTQVTFDGNGNGTFQILADSHGILRSGSFTYSVARDGTVTTSMGDSGIISADWNIFILVDTDVSDNDLYISAGIKKSSGMSNASLDGTFIAWLYGTGSDSYWTNLRQLDFDGNGNVTWQELVHSGGSTDSGSFNYSVASDGTVTTGMGISGIISTDGNILIMVDTDASGNELGISVGIKKSSGMSNSSLNGKYIMCQYGADPEHWTDYTQLTFDGNGNLTYKILADSHGELENGSGTYSVASDGTVITSMGDSGIISTDGNIFILVDTDASDNSLYINIGIKKSLRTLLPMPWIPLLLDENETVDTYTNSLGMTFNQIPAGTFMMGRPEDEFGRFEDNRETLHQVTLTNDFYIQATGMTQGLTTLDPELLWLNLHN